MPQVTRVTIRRFCAMFGLTLAILLSIYSKGLATPSNARQGVLELNPANTHIDYTLQGWPHVTNGTFQLARGIIRIDPATGKADGSVVVSATSGDSGSHMRDTEMKDSILEVERYPEITFMPQHAEGQRSGQREFPAAIRGILTLHGKPHEITLNITVQPSGDRFTAAAHFAVPYVAWGLKNPSLLIFRCADTVYLDVKTQGQVTWVPAGTADSTPRRSSDAPRLN
jgi:polyisoprenoid-binding protein YceI